MVTGNLSKHARGEKRGQHDYENELKMSNEDYARCRTNTRETVTRLQTKM